jgi:NAD(P)-dependent dehydrogenase (short-subunit alcohol dehydrogenase family)
VLLDAVVAECVARRKGHWSSDDVSVESQCKELIDRSLSEYGRIDTLINNAGISMRSRFVDLGGVEPIER